jgi:hypothetical protein
MAKRRGLSLMLALMFLVKIRDYFCFSLFLIVYPFVKYAKIDTSNPAIKHLVWEDLDGNTIKVNLRRLDEK